MAAAARIRRRNIPELRAAFEEIRRLSEVHFYREEEIFYPALRPRYPALLARMDEQHEYIRELETEVAALLADVPADAGPRWLDELRRFAIEFHDRIQHHIVDEEEQLLRVAAALLDREQQRMAARMRAVQPPDWQRRPA